VFASPAVGVQLRHRDGVIRAKETTEGKAINLQFDELSKMIDGRLKANLPGDVNCLAPNRRRQVACMIASQTTVVLRVLPTLMCERVQELHGFVSPSRRQQRRRCDARDDFRDIVIDLADLSP
jgi:hypothetical protein